MSTIYFLFPLDCKIVQTTAHQYEFPGVPYPDEIRNRTNPPTPSATEVRTYLTNYCKSQGTLEKFQFDTTVSNIAKHADGSWTVFTTTENNGKTMNKTEKFAFVILCTGLFSNTPNMLDIPGSEEFVSKGKGRIMHTSQWNNNDEFRNKRVLVIGNGKSAADAAVAAAIVAQEMKTPPPIQAIRKQNWYVPRFMLRFKWAFHSRIVSALLPRYYESTSWMSKILHPLCYPIKYMLWRTLELVFLVLLRLPVKVWPKLGTIDTEGSLSVPLLVTDERQLAPIREGQIDMRICEVTQFYSTKHARLSTGDIVPVDVVVMGTGWKLDYSFLDQETVLSKLDFTSDGLWLYRNILSPNLPGIAFIGSNALTFMNIYTSYVQSYWLVGLLSGQRQPVSPADMMDCIHREKEFKRRLYPKCALRGATIEAYMQHYHDILFQEQGINPNIYSGIFGPLCNVVFPILPETMSPSFDQLRLKYCNKED
jgi:dimethylaniline monooxygenase (N-oxide forming)